MKPYKTSMILGKFLPPHFGHMYMIQMALAISEEVYVLVFTMKSEPLSGVERYLAIDAHFRDHEDYKNGRIKIKFVEKNLPQYPNEHPKFWDIWRKEIKKQVPVPIDCIVGSESYVIRLSQEFINCDHYIVDKDRITVSISGTSCRNHTFDEWENIIPEFRPQMVKKFVFVGGESTGKSTITKIMAEVFKTNYVEEYGREFCKTKPPTEWSSIDFYTVSQIQRFHVTNAVKTSNKILFCDTDAIITQAFHELYLGQPSKEIDEYTIKKDNYFHYFLLAPTIDFEDDSTREFADKRKEQYDLIESLLKKWKRNYTVISEPDLKKRVRNIKFLVEVLTSQK